ncbi:hypothetical protein [Paucibacter sp. XJ19-41]|uniref:hypothetical protein n=1 Tax=Paucibacter sp. XJ19-41 TaxID=2927824 RepID=UPI00234A05F6|nr:hypothetical protein [Paucibacter sp. XJ19-41]MDC6171009.1 hypothetical protein [Paucibacter sp. XJ19-41]
MDEPSWRSRLVMAILWPSFLMAGVLDVLVFSLLDPAALVEASSLSGTSIYTLGFLGFWIVTGLSSALSLWLAGLPLATKDER